MWCVGLPSLILETEKILLYQQQLGEWDNLNHLIICKTTNQACIIDPFDGKFWLDFCQEQKVEITEIWLTHTHWDHIKGVEELYCATDNQPILRCHILEQQRGYESTRAHWWNHHPLSSVTERFGAIDFAIHCTPGHSPGHVTIIGQGIIITGDCLFLYSCGRTDLFGGDQEHQRQSVVYLKDIFRTTPIDSLILPGHQYEREDGSIPTTLKLDVFLRGNLAIQSAHDIALWNNLPFLSFDDNMAEQARRQKAQQS